MTDRYQTTVPESVRRALHLGKRDRIHYTIRPDGEVVLTRAAASDGNDPALAPLADDEWAAASRWSSTAGPFLPRRPWHSSTSRSASRTLELLTDKTTSCA
ncbi:MAG: type II toxin-antitoxin system PrlF family antitoxin [Pelomonas sp.]|nr:type II toxin-antitoxin system PrlF family antitoxin [Roseateles sp.]